MRNGRKSELFIKILKYEGDLFTTFDFKKFRKVPEMKNKGFQCPSMKNTLTENLAGSLARQKPPEITKSPVKSLVDF